MDNITHSLIGLTAGLAIQRLPLPRKPHSPTFLAAILVASIVGNNFPDLDFLTAIFTGGGKLNYLLQHRGYTHTFFFAPFEAIFVTAIAAAWAGVRKGVEWTRSQWFWLFLISLFSIGLHIGADYCNDYGVHPFAPFDSRWFYGGVLFIVEPLLWIATIPLLVFSSCAVLGVRADWVQKLGVLAALGFQGLIWFSGVLNWRVALALTALQGLMLVWQKRKPGLTQPFVGIAVTMVAFVFAGQRVERMIRLQIVQEHPEEQITQLVTTPAPGNPFCWRVIPVSLLSEAEISSQSAGRIMIPFYERLGSVSLWPAVFSPADCFPAMAVERTAPLMKPSLSQSVHVTWVGEFRGTSEELGFLAKNYCRFGQLLRFARVPFWRKGPAGELIAGDLRYDREPGLGFAEFAFRAEEACLPDAPNWEKPSGLLPAGH